MRLVCPNCKFARSVPDEKIPPGSCSATCPKCKQKFRFRELAPPLFGPSEAERAQTSQAMERRNRPAPSQPSRLRSPQEPQATWAASLGSQTPDPRTQAPSFLPEPQIPVVTEPEPLSQIASEPLAVEEPNEEFSAPAEATPPLPSPEPALSRPEPLVVQEPLEPPLEPQPAAVQPEWQDVPLLANPGLSGAAKPKFSEPEPQEKPVTLADIARAKKLRAQAQQELEQDKSEENAKSVSQPPVREKLSDIWAKLQAMGPHDGDNPDPAPGETEADEASLEEVPWERLDHYGFLPGLAQTLKRVLLKPADFFEGLPPGQGLTKALVFNLILLELFQVLTLLWVLFGLVGPEKAEILKSLSSTPAVNFFLQLLIFPMLLAIGVFIDAGITHGLMLLFRSATRPFDDTFRVVCYASAPLIFMAIPIAGFFLFPVVLIWCMTLQAIGLKRVHKAAYAQSLAAVLLKYSFTLIPVIFVALHGGGVN